MDKNLSRGISDTIKLTLPILSLKLIIFAFSIENYQVIANYQNYT